MKKLLVLLILLSAKCAMAGVITFVTMTGAGSMADTTLRKLTPAIERQTGSAVVIVNAPGADGLIALNRLLNAPSNEEVYLAGNSSLGYLRTIKGHTVPVVPVSGIASGVMSMYAPVASIENSRKIASTSPMVAMSICMLDDKDGRKSEHVGYKQFSQAVVDLAAGRIDYMLAPQGTGAIEGMVQSGRLRKVKDLGRQFVWVAVYAREGADTADRAEQFKRAVAETKLGEVTPFAVGPREIAELERKEKELMLATAGCMASQQ